MPNRIIKDSISSSERLNGLGDFEFRLWVHLLTYVDDYGRGDARPAVIRGRCFPLREELTLGEVEAALLRLRDAGCITLYEVEGGRYFYVERWEQHQNIRNKRSKIPAPRNDGAGSRAIDGNCDQLQSNACNCDQLQSNACNCASVSESVSVSESESKSLSESVFVSQSVSDARAQSDAQTDSDEKPPPPSMEEVNAYATARRSNVDPAAFFDYYTANGWKMGNNAMRDWRAAFRAWERLEHEKKRDHPKTGSGYSSPPSYDIERAEQRMNTTVPKFRKRVK